MKKLLCGALLLALLTIVPVSATADVSVHVSVPLPPAIVFSAPPVTVVIPGTYVYAIPDVPVDIFFYGGWWWRPWEGRWYRSRHYDRGWAYYKGRPSFYGKVPPRWRDDYRNHRWQGHPWKHQRVPYQQVERNWVGWERRRHWERQQYWGVPEMKSRQQSQQRPRSVQPQPRPQSREVYRPQPQRQPQSREVNRPQPQRQPQSREVNRPQQRPQSREAQPQRFKHQQGKPERGKGEKQDKGGRN